jgi:hypothetical protein
MSDDLTVECGSADDFGRRSVVATCGLITHRDRFNTDDAFRRRRFAEATLETFQWAVTAEALKEIDALLVREASLCDTARASDGLRPKVTRLAEVPPCQVEWLWPGRVALGAVTLLAGDPGLGKSFVTLDMAARVSRGGRWPEEQHGVGSKEQGVIPPLPSAAPCSALPAPCSAPASVVLFSAEDDLARTIRPRLEALGADCQRIVAVESLEGRDGEGKFARPFDMSRDLAHLTAVIEGLSDCRLVVIDPISAFLGKVSENANAEVRSLLAPLADLATKHNLAIVVVSHLRKEEGAAVYRTMGSMAFVAAARAAWMVTRDPDSPRRRLLLPVKNNLADDVAGLAYTIEPHGPHGVPVVCWAAGRVETPTDLAASRPARPAHRPNVERQQVTGWLREILAGERVPTKEVRDTAEAHGFAYVTVRRAFRELGGQATRKDGDSGPWMWQLPSSAEFSDQKSHPRLLITESNDGRVGPTAEPAIP